MPRYRNRIALNPLLRKGGVHRTSSTAQRRDLKNNLESLVDEWEDEIIETVNDEEEIVLAATSTLQDRMPS